MKEKIEKSPLNHTLDEALEGSLETDKDVVFEEVIEDEIA